MVKDKRNRRRGKELKVKKENEEERKFQGVVKEGWERREDDLGYSEE